MENNSRNYKTCSKNVILEKKSIYIIKRFYKQQKNNLWDTYITIDKVKSLLCGPHSQNLCVTKPPIPCSYILVSTVPMAMTRTTTTSRLLAPCHLLVSAICSWCLGEWWMILFPESTFHNFQPNKLEFDKRI